MSPATAPARLLIAGDTHGNAGWINQLAELAYAYSCDAIRIEGLASDNEGDGRAWGLLELPALTFLGGGERAR